MNRFLPILLWCGITCGGIIHSSCTLAEAYIPKEPEEVIAQWNTTPSESLRALQIQQRLQPEDPNRVMQLANEYLVQAAQPGQSRLYGVAEALLKPLIENNTDNIAVLLLWAQIQQHQHRFTLAHEILQKILSQQPDNYTAHLLDARLHLIQGNAAAAQAACMRLLGHTDLLTLSACTLEARSTLGDKELSESYAQLQKIISTQGLPDDERKIWILQILADMAVRLQQPQAALDFLSQIKSKNSLSVWVQWADINLALQNNQVVIDELTPLVSTSSQADDSLLVRLAVAEKKLARTTHWQKQVRERIALREQRDDQAHAADLAIYYLDIAPDVDKALHWAERNYQLAREASDKHLLVRAQQAANAAIVIEKGEAS
jgi:hypothetical protein